MTNDEVIVVQQSSEVDNETIDDEGKEECLETTKSCACECESTLPVSSDDTTVATCEHSEQLLVCGTSDPTAENIAVSGEMCLPVEALVNRGKKLTNKDQTVRYPSITGTVSERCVQSVEHIIQVFFFINDLWHVAVLKIEEPLD